MHKLGIKDAKWRKFNAAFMSKEQLEKGQSALIEELET
jgi:hypothetical protein